MRRTSRSGTRAAVVVVVAAVAASGCQGDATSDTTANAHASGHGEHVVAAPLAPGPVDALELAHGVASAQITDGLDANGLALERVLPADGAAVLRFAGGGAMLEIALELPVEDGDGRLSAFRLGLADDTVYTSRAADDCVLDVRLARRDILAVHVRCELPDSGGDPVSVQATLVAVTGPAEADASPGGTWTDGFADLRWEGGDVTDAQLPFAGTESPDGTYTRILFRAEAGGLDLYIGGHHGQEEGEFHSTDFETDVNTAAVIPGDGRTYVPAAGGACDISMVYVDDAAVGGGFVCRDLAPFGEAGSERISAAGTVVAFI